MKYLKKCACWLGWHSIFVGFDSIHHHSGDPLHFLIYAKCKWCGYAGQIDSQGNLF